MMHLIAFEGHGRTTSSNQRSENQGDSTEREEIGLSVDLAIAPLMEEKITAFGTKETHEEAYRLGAAAMFDKPFDFNDLLCKVHELLPPPSG